MKKKLNQEEIAKKIIAIVDMHDSLERTLKQLEKCFGCVDGPLIDEIWRSFKLAMGLTSELIGDRSDWLSWYIYECDCGRYPMKAGIGKKLKKISSPLSLAKLIAEHNS